MKIYIFDKMMVQDAFLAELDPIWVPKGPLKGAQDEPKAHPKRVPNRVQNRNPKNRIEKWTAQGPRRTFLGEVGMLVFDQDALHEETWMLVFDRRAV